MTKSDLPTNTVNRSRQSNSKRRKPMELGASPIAADGGFGPMDEDESDEDTSEQSDKLGDSSVDAEEEQEFGDDFDDFEAGAERDDFGEFDDGFETSSISREPPETEPDPPLNQSILPSISPFVSESSSILAYLEFSLRDILRNLELTVDCKAAPGLQRTR